MSEVVIAREFSFSAGHRLLNHPGKCVNPHGHNYLVRVTATAEELDASGMVVDFAVLKDKLGGWLDAHWDHTFLVYEADTVLLAALEQVDTTRPLFICPFNTTAENLARYLLDAVCPELFNGTGVRIQSVEVRETDNCGAIASRKD